LTANQPTARAESFAQAAGRRQKNGFKNPWNPVGIWVEYTEMARVGKYQPVPVPMSTREPNPRVDPVPVSNPSNTGAAEQLYGCSARQGVQCVEVVRLGRSQASQHVQNCPNLTDYDGWCARTAAGIFPAPAPVCAAVLFAPAPAPTLLRSFQWMLTRPGRALPHAAQPIAQDSSGISEVQKL
jgi:hypothetical protein